MSSVHAADRARAESDAQNKKTKNVQIYALFIPLQHPLHAGAQHLHTHATQTETNDIVRSTAKGSYMSSATKTHT